MAEGAAPQRTPGVPPRAALDPLTMTDEMEAIDEATQYRRKIDHTLARFSAAHDEMEAEEAKRRERRERLSPASIIESTRTALQRVVTTTPQGESEAVSEEQAAQTRLQEKKARKIERSVRFGRIAAAVVAGLVFLGIGGAWGAQTYFDAKFTQVSALDENSSDIQDADAQANDENFLMVGSDTRDGASDEEGVGTADSTPGARSDTVMVAHIPADRKRVVVTSFPRDLEIDRPECQRWDTAQSKTTDEKVPEQKIAKLNTAYAVGGPPCTTKVIQQITGLRINHFIGIDFNGFKEMVDAVHGVTVHNETPIDDTILGKVLLETGDVTISGDQALNFVRARHVKGDPTSDYGRIKRQQLFIGALLKKVMSSDVVLDPGKLSDFITAFAKATFGDNLGVKQMMSLAQSMKGLDPSKITFLTVPTTGEHNSRGNEVLVRSKAKALFDALRNNAPLPNPNAPIPPSEQAPPTSTSKSKTGSSKSTTTSKKSGTTG
ncbi:LCP family protein required for cell wall assembly [Amycolatopsis lexingtonensis]|uniref:LCP family protein required for cell wall assembly n=1 Tax=Amycolatopsis lexingtonensis TaxID=218822 RepID=A0ABR9IA77_9PSEU|nr:LCP family protein [Amycolatopsis lexingtonensis]MBE1500065.1 LCP family protein required for cell wall assembly [Amycolatopsis lexingtonensis]